MNVRVREDVIHPHRKRASGIILLIAAPRPWTQERLLCFPLCFGQLWSLRIPRLGAPRLILLPWGLVLIHRLSQVVAAGPKAASFFFSQAHGLKWTGLLAPGPSMVGDHVTCHPETWPRQIRVGSHVNHIHNLHAALPFFPVFVHSM